MNLTLESTLNVISKFHFLKSTKFRKLSFLSIIINIIGLKHRGGGRSQSWGNGSEPNHGKHFLSHFTKMKLTFVLIMTSFLFYFTFFKKSEVDLVRRKHFYGGATAKETKCPLTRP